MFGSSQYGVVSTIRFISPHATDKDRQGRPGQRPDTLFFEAPSSPDDQKRLIFKLKERIKDAERIMALTGQDEAKKWKGIRGLLKKMRNELPYLINDGTWLELSIEETVGGVTEESLGFLNYSQFIEIKDSKATIDKHHQYIAAQGLRVGSGDNERETLRAEDMLLMLYTALRYELEDHENFEAYFVDNDESEEPAENVVLMPHFGMENSERAQKRWEAAYEALANEGYLRRNEVDYHGWVYICCGQQTPPDGPIVWHGSNASLAHLVRKHFRGKWDKALKIFCPENGKTFPVSFNTTHKPVDDVTKSIDQAFQTANSH